MEFQDTIYTKEEGVALLTLNRPRTLNDCTEQMGKEWVAALEDAQQDPSIGAFIVTGAGRAFCSGGNPRLLLAGKQHYIQTGQWTMVPDLAFLARGVAKFEKPYIAAINGPAVGGGFDMLCLCDIRIASQKARLGAGFIRMGEVPGTLCYSLPRLVGIPRALELLWSGRIIGAEEALRIGLVDEVVPHEELLPRAKLLARQLARGPAIAIRYTKRLVQQCLQMDLLAAIEAHDKAAHIVSATEDSLEGPRAWIEKREPIFKGR